MYVQTRVFSLAKAFIYLRTGDNSTVGYIQGVNGAMQVRRAT